MRSRIIVLLIFLLMVFSQPVQAQSPAVLASLKILLWPEYDQPSMLVIEEFTVTEETQVPTTLDIRIPRDANITAVAYENNGGLLLANYQNKNVEESNWQVITLFITERTLYHIEYYQPLERDGDKRMFTFKWKGEYAVNEFDIEIRTPQDSTNIKTNPVIPLVVNSPYMSGGIMMNRLDEGQTYQLDLEYSRTNNSTVEDTSNSSVEPLVAVTEDTEGRATLNNLPVFLGGIGLALIVTGLFFFLRGQSRAASKPRKRSRPTNEPTAQIYCHECGTRALEGDRFCRVCGSKLRQ